MAVGVFAATQCLHTTLNVGVLLSSHTNKGKESLLASSSMKVSFVRRRLVGKAMLTVVLSSLIKAI